MKKKFDSSEETKTDAGHLPTRRTFLKCSGAWALTAFTLSAAPNSVFGRNLNLSAQIVGTLNFALTLEFLQDEFYRAALSRDGLIPLETRDVFERIGEDQAAHVKLLRSLLGNRAVGKSDFDFTAGGAFGDVFDDYQTFLAVAQVFEDTGARACKGQTDNLRSRADILTTARQIQSVETRHAATVRQIRADESLLTNDSSDAPAAPAQITRKNADNAPQTDENADLSGAFTSQIFDEPLTSEQVSAITDLFIKN